MKPKQRKPRKKPLKRVYHAPGCVVRAKIKRIKAPTQVLVGKADILTPPAFSRELAGLIPNARLRLLPGGHGFFIEEAPRLNGALLDFLKAITR